MRRCLTIVLLGSFAAVPLAAQDSARAYADRPFVIERFDERARFEADGTSRISEHVRVRIQSTAALEAFGQLHFPYLSANQDLTVDTVRVDKAGAPPVLAPASAVQDLSGPFETEAPVYSDLREKVVTVPALRPGDTLEYTITSVTRAAIAPGQFWYASNMGHAAIVLEHSVVADVPAAIALRVDTRDFGNPTVTDSGDRRLYRWQGANLTTDTAGQARAAGQAPEQVSIQFSTFTSWAAVGRWYAGLERERETPDARIRHTADSLVHGRRSFADSVAAVYDYVSRNFRYVSLSFGLGRFQPHAASDVMANQYADCKDKHTLLASLLRAVGITSAPALISSDHAIDTLVPGPYHFDHLISVVTSRRDTFWLDATPGIAPFRYLLPELRGKPALVMPLEGPARIVTTPAHPPFPAVDSTVVTAQLADPARVTGAVNLALRGDAEVIFRAAFQAIPADRLGALAPQLAQNLGFTGTAAGLTHGDPGATADAFRFQFTIDDPAAVTWTGNRGRLHVPLPHAWSGVDSARTDSIEVVDEPTVERLTLTLPAGVSVQPPAPVALDRDFASYHATYELNGRTLTVVRVTRAGARVPRSRWREVRDFDDARNTDAQQDLILTRASVSLAAAGNDADALYNAGLEAWRNHNFMAAVRFQQRAVAANPRHVDAWAELGRLWMAINYLDSAESALRRAIALDSTVRYANGNLAQVLWRKGRLDSAVAYYRVQMALTPRECCAADNLGRVLMAQHQDSAAVDVLEQATAMTPNDARVLNALGTALIHVGRADEGFAALERSVVNDPSPLSLNNAAYVLADARIHLDSAETWTRAAIDSVEAPLAGISIDAAGLAEYRAMGALPSYWDTLGWILLQRGDTAAAERYIRAGWFLVTHQAMGDHLATIEEHTGRRVEAQRLRALLRNAFADSARGAIPFGPPPRIAPGRAGANAENAARTELLNLRTVRLGRSPVGVTSDVTVLVGPGSHIVDVRFPGSPPFATDQLEGMLKAAKLEPVFPDQAPIRLLLAANLSCTTGSACVLVFYPAGAWAPSAGMQLRP